jgi:hypothetical protein
MLSACVTPSLWVSKFSHSYKTGDKIIILYILIFHFWITNWKTKDSAPDDSKHFLTSVWSSFLHEWNFDLSVLSHRFKGFITFLYVVGLSCILCMTHGDILCFFSIYFFLDPFPYWQIIKRLHIYLMYVCFHLMLTSSMWISCWYVPLRFKTSLFALTHWGRVFFPLYLS